MFNAAIYERTQILVGDVGVRRLHAANVFLVGTGGVGGHCAEALVRAGVGRITICDHDVVSSTNKNRQLIALDSTIGKSKVQELCKRLRDISSHCVITSLDAFLFPEDVAEVLDAQQYTHIVDCIDSVECKLSLLETSVKMRLKVYSSCGAGGKLDPSMVTIGDLYDTENDALARVCRNELRKRGIGPGCITVVHSKEKGLSPLEPQRQEAGGRDRAINGTISYMPPLFGLLLSSAVIRDIFDPVVAEKARAKRQKDAMKKEDKKKGLSQGQIGGGSRTAGEQNKTKDSKSTAPQLRFSESPNSTITHPAASGGMVISPGRLAGLQYQISAPVQSCSSSMAVPLKLSGCLDAAPKTNMMNKTPYFSARNNNTSVTVSGNQKGGSLMWNTLNAQTKTPTIAIKTVDNNNNEIEAEPLIEFHRTDIEKSDGSVVNGVNVKRTQQKQQPLPVEPTSQNSEGGYSDAALMTVVNYNSGSYGSGVGGTPQYVLNEGSKRIQSQDASPSLLLPNITSNRSSRPLHQSIKNAVIFDSLTKSPRADGDDDAAIFIDLKIVEPGLSTLHGVMLALILCRDSVVLMVPKTGFTIKIPFRDIYKIELEQNIRLVLHTGSEAPRQYIIDCRGSLNRVMPNEFIAPKLFAIISSVIVSRPVTFLSRPSSDYMKAQEEMRRSEAFTETTGLKVYDPSVIAVAMSGSTNRTTLTPLVISEGNNTRHLVTAAGATTTISKNQSTQHLYATNQSLNRSEEISVRSVYNAHQQPRSDFVANGLTMMMNPTDIESVQYNTTSAEYNRMNDSSRTATMRLFEQLHPTAEPQICGRRDGWNPIDRTAYDDGIVEDSGDLSIFDGNSCQQQQQQQQYNRNKNNLTRSARTTELQHSIIPFVATTAITRNTPSTLSKPQPCDYYDHTSSTRVSASLLPEKFDSQTNSRIVGVSPPPQPGISRSINIAPSSAAESMERVIVPAHARTINIATTEIDASPQEACFTRVVNIASSSATESLEPVRGMSNTRIINIAPSSAAESLEPTHTRVINIAPSTTVENNSFELQHYDDNGVATQLTAAVLQHLAEQSERYKTYPHSGPRVRRTASEDTHGINHHCPLLHDHNHDSSSASTVVDTSQQPSQVVHAVQCDSTYNDVKVAAESPHPVDCSPYVTQSIPRNHNDNAYNNHNYHKSTTIPYPVALTHAPDDFVFTNAPPVESTRYEKPVSHSVPFTDNYFTYAVPNQSPPPPPTPIPVPTPPYTPPSPAIHRMVSTATTSLRPRSISVDLKLKVSARDRQVAREALLNAMEDKNARIPVKTPPIEPPSPKVIIHEVVRYVPEQSAMRQSPKPVRENSVSVQTDHTVRTEGTQVDFLMPPSSSSLQQQQLLYSDTRPQSFTTQTAVPVVPSTPSTVSDNELDAQGDDD